MTDSIRKVSYYAVEVPHAAGQGTKILSALKEAGVNLLVFSGFPTTAGRAQLDFVPENATAFEKALQGRDVKLDGRKDAFLIQGDDRPGATFDVLGKLSSQGISITAAQAVSAGNKRWGMVVWVSPSDYAKASKALGV